jgi:hypothetical protein
MGNRAPIAVGGVGGSGTRVVAAILQEAGLWIGGDLNEAYDNLWFTLLFKHPNILETSEQRFEQLTSLFLAAMRNDDAIARPHLDLLNELVADGRPQHDPPWLELRAESLRCAVATGYRAPHWGWKEPNTHIVADRLAAHIPGLRYIHVGRSGLDMAYSANQNQLNLWGPAVLGGDHAVNPRNSLRFWRWAHTRILKIGEEMGERFLFIRFEDLCRDPARYVRLILTFAGAQTDQEAMNRAIQLVEPPASIGRYSARSLDDFDADDVAYVRRLGFSG